MKRNQKPAANKVYTLVLHMCPGYDDPRFSFHAVDDQDADHKAFSWACYQGMTSYDYTFRPATESEIQYQIHDEYLR